MKRITVSASKKYDVLIGSGLLDELGRRAAELLKGRRCVVVSDSNVAPLFMERAKKSLTDAGFAVLEFVFAAGEASKNAQTYLQLINHCAENRLTRADALVALGGGVVGDLAGFAAATYLRGIHLIQIPTTLLACVDSSVGGKTAVDLPAGKNLLGAFHQPDLVLCDPALLDNLPAEIFADGMAEVIKYGMIGDGVLLDQLEQNHARDQMEYVLHTCVDMKRRVVEDDEFDTGGRQILNLGHTFAHSIEKLSDYAMPHGRAVAIGLVIITRAAVRKGVCPAEALERLLRLLKRYELPVATEYAAAELAEVALSDKKRAAEYITLALPCGVGESRLEKLPVTELLHWAQAGVDA